MGNLTVDSPVLSLREILFGKSAPAQKTAEAEQAVFSPAPKRTQGDSYVSEPSKEKPKKHISAADVQATLSAIFREQIREENKKTWVDKSVDFVKGLFGISKKLPVGNFLGVHFDSNVLDAIATVKRRAASELAKHGVNFSELSPVEKMKYLAALTNHYLGNIDNEQFLKALTDLHKERVRNEVSSNLPPVIKQFDELLRSKFSDFFQKTGKMDNAAVQTAMKHSSKEIANELIKMYSGTIESRRKEILSEAFKVLPEGMDKESIINFAITSESMSEEQFKFAKTLIESSDLPDDVKQEYLKKIEDDRKAQRFNSVQQAMNFYNSRVDGGYHYHKAKLSQQDAAYEELCAKQKEINQKLAEAKEKRNQFENEKYYTDRRLVEIKKEMQEKIAKGEEVSVRTKLEYADLENKTKDLKANLYDIRKDISFGETDWSVTQTLRRDAIDSSASHVRSMQAYGSSAVADCSFFNGIGDKIKAIFS